MLSSSAQISLYVLNIGLLSAQEYIVERALFSVVLQALSLCALELAIQQIKLTIELFRDLVARLIKLSVVHAPAIY